MSGTHTRAPGLGHGQAFSVKGQGVSILGFAGQLFISVIVVPKLSWTVCKQTGWLCSNKTLFMNSEICIPYQLQVSQHIILIFIFFYHLKMWRPFLAHEPYKNRRLVGFGGRAVVCLPLPSEISYLVYAWCTGEVREGEHSRNLSPQVLGTVAKHPRDLPSSG